MKKLVSVVSAPFAWTHERLPGLPGPYYLAVLLLPGGLILLPLLWWLGGRGRRKSGGA